MSIPIPVIDGLLSVGGKLIDRLFPDKAERDRAKLQLLQMQQDGELQEMALQMQAITAEAKSGNWLAASWRPITMLTFTSLIVARWMGYSAPGITEAEILELWGIVKLGLGGYVIGRSAEKIAPQIAGVMRK